MYDKTNPFTKTELLFNLKISDTKPVIVNKKVLKFFLDFIMKPNYRLEWDHAIEEIKILERVNNNLYTQH
jgi:hypothetical protein